MIRNSLLAGMCWLVGPGAMCVCAPASAQSSSPPAAQTEDLSEIVVTAQRRQEREVDVPITITSLSADQLSDANAQTLSNIAQLTPALRFDYNSAFVQPTIRGVGTSITTAGSGSNVGIYVDGFYSPNPLEADFELLNVQNVQVLKGPQGTLFGRNTTAGAILVTTAEPSMQPSAIVDVSYGRFDTQRYAAYATTGLTSNIAVDIEGLYTSGNGHVTDILNGNSDVGNYSNYTVRAGIKVELSDTISMLFRYTHEAVNDPTFTLANTFTTGGVPQTIGTVIPGAVIATSPDQVAPTTRDFFWTKNDVGQLTTKFDFDFATLTSYTQFRTSYENQGIDLDSTSAPVFSILIPIDDRTFTQEFLMNSKGSGALQWTAGLFYLDYTDHFLGTQFSSGGLPFTQFADSSSDTVSYAAFADGTYEVAPQIFLTAGLRYNRDESRDAYFYNGGVRTDVPTLTSNRVTPRGVVRYKFNGESSAYFSVSGGYKAPLLNVGGDATVPVQAEEITAYELGYKFAVGVVSLETSVFHYEYKDLQVASYNGTQSLINNAADSHINGGEAELRWQIASGLDLTAGAAYTDAKFDTYPDSPSYHQCLNFAVCGVAGYGMLLSTPQNASGYEMPRAPKFTGNLGMKYTTGLAKGKVSFTANLYSTSRFFFDSSDQFAQGGYTTLGLRADWTDPSGRLTVGLYGDNVTDQRYRIAINAGTFGVGSVWNYPATYGGEIRLRL
jgi:iron complex outermembrane recepter protein